MLDFKGRDIDSFMAKLKKHELLLKGRIATTRRRLVKDVFTDLVKGSPQWSGNLASQWYIEFHGSTGAYSPISRYSERQWARPAYQMGHPDAVNSTLARELPKISEIRWNSKVSIVNHAPYAEEVEEGVSSGGGALRDVNLKMGQVAMVAYVLTKYSKLATLKKRV